MSPVDFGRMSRARLSLGWNRDRTRNTEGIWRNIRSWSKSCRSFLTHQRHIIRRIFLFVQLFNTHLRSRSALNNAASFMQPFADVMAKKFGAVVSVLMVLPIGEKDGEIELRRYHNSYQEVILQTHQPFSVHSGTTNDTIPMTWPIFDRSGFAEAQKSMINFGRHVFSTSTHFIYENSCILTHLQAPLIALQG